MNTKSKLKRRLQALLIKGISFFALRPALAQDIVRVTADNYVRAESDFQMKGYIENFNCFGKFHHSRKPVSAEEGNPGRNLDIPETATLGLEGSMAF